MRIATVLATLTSPLAAQGPVDPTTGRAIEDWLPWNVTRRLLVVGRLGLAPGIELDYRAGDLFEGVEEFLPEQSDVVASLRWPTGDLVLFDVEGDPEELIEDLVNLQEANGFTLAAGDDWGILENPSTFPLDFCGGDGRNLSVSGDEGLNRPNSRRARFMELALVVRRGSSRACARGGRVGSGGDASMPRPMLYAPRGVRASSSGAMSGMESVTRTNNITAPRHEVADLLAHFAAQMEEQGWFGSAPTDFGGAAAQMFTQYAEAPDEESTAGWLALILLSRYDLDTGQIAAQLSVRRVMQKAP